MGQQGSAADELSACFRRDAPRVAAYAARHTDRSRVDDVVAETFAVAWRRWDVVPDPPLPWLIATARNLLREDRRSLMRGRRLLDRVALLDSVAGHAQDAADSVAHREHALRALAALSEDQREALLLVAWDGLSITDAAAVLDLRPGAFRARLHRARAALAASEGARPATSTRTFELQTETR